MKQLLCWLTIGAISLLPTPTLAQPDTPESLLPEATFQQLPRWRGFNLLEKFHSQWNFRSSFGILDSQRADVQYEDFHGHQLDRQMLDLLQKYRANRG